MTLEQLGRENGVLWSDKTTPCLAKSSATAAAKVAARAAGSTANQCVIPVLGNMTTSSFALYTFSVSVFVQALALVSFSAVADHGKYRTSVSGTRCAESNCLQGVTERSSWQASASVAPSRRCSSSS